MTQLPQPGELHEGIGARVPTGYASAGYESDYDHCKRKRAAKDEPEEHPEENGHFNKTLSTAAERTTQNDTEPATLIAHHDRWWQSYREPLATLRAQIAAAEPS